MKATLVESAWGGVRTKGSYFKGKYHRIASRRGKKRALIAVAHKILISAYYILGSNAIYKDLGEDYFNQKDKTRLKQYLTKKLEKLGYNVTLEESLAA